MSVWSDKKDGVNKGWTRTSWSLYDSVGLWVSLAQLGRQEQQGLRNRGRSCSPSILSTCLPKSGPGSL